MQMSEAIGFRRGEMVSLIGAGGKTTTLFRLAKELRDAGSKVLATTTTKIFKPAKPHVDRLFLAQDLDALLMETAKISKPAVIGVGQSVDDDGQLVGLPSAWLDALKESRQFDGILVEADGAASRPFKVPSEIEPVVAQSCDLVVWVMAIKVLGKPLDATSVHRAERAIGLLDVAPGTPVTKQHIVNLVRHPLGCLKGIPSHARKVALLNQADSPEECETAGELARALAPLGFERVLITSYTSQAPVKSMIAI